MEHDEKALEHAWSYFELHANQRITVFNYFVVFAGLLSTGLVAAAQGPGRIALIGVFFGLLLALLSFVFWKIDQRTSFLIKHAENVIKTLEPPLAPLFADEVERTDTAKATEGLWSYGKAFRTIFSVMAVVGICGAALSGLNAYSKSDGSIQPIEPSVENDA